MSEAPEVRGWRAIPPALALGLAIEVTWLVVNVIHQLVDHEYFRAARWSLAGSGVAFATYVLDAYGLYELARRSTGRAAVCVTIASWVTVGKLVLMITYQLLLLKIELHPHHWLFEGRQYAWIALHAALVVSLALAVFPAKRGLAIAAIVAMCVFQPPPPLAKLFYGWIDAGHTTFVVFDATLRAIVWVFIALLVGNAAVGPAKTEPELAVVGLRRAARSLWLRVIAAFSITGLTLLLLVGRGEGGVSVMKLAMITGLVVNMIALLQLALGLLAAARAALADLPRFPLVIAAGLSVFYAGIMFGQVPQMYRLLYGEGSGRDLQASLTAWSIAGPLTAIVSLAIVASTIGAFSARRSLPELRQQASSRGLGFVLLMLASIAFQAWLLPEASSLGSFVMLTLVAAVCGFCALVMMAKLCTLASEAVERVPGLPTATAISGV